MRVPQHKQFVPLLIRILIISGFILIASTIFPTSDAQAIEDYNNPESSIDPAPAYAPTNDIGLYKDERVFIGENFNFYVTFDESSGSEGYRPFIDLLFPSNGADGAAGTDTPDGIDFVSAKVFDQDITADAIVQTFPDDDGPDFPGTTGCVSHPFARDASGSRLRICGTTGDTVVTLPLPFSSITQDMPELSVKVGASISELADLEYPLTIKSRTGYANGSDSLDNPTADPVLLSSVSSDGTGWAELTITPKVIYIEKDYDGPKECPYLSPDIPEGDVIDKDECPYAYINPVYETTTGPNYTRSYSIKVDIANGQTITDLDITEFVPAEMAFMNMVSLTPGGTVTASPAIGIAQNPPDNELAVNYASLSSDAEIVFEFFVPEDDADSNAIIDPATGDEATTDNIASAIGDWTPVDTRDTASSDNAYTNVCPACEALHTLHMRSLAAQKSVEIETDTGATGYTPGDRVKYTITFQISDYFTFDNLVVTDTLYDGHRIDLTAGYEPVFSISDRNTNLVDTAFTYTPPPTAPAVSDDLIIDESAIGNTGPGPDATDGSTLLTFDLSTAMTNNGEADGILQGGEVVSSDLPATGEIVFYAVIQEDFSDEYPSGDASVDHGDKLYNTIEISGDILDNSDLITVLGAEDNDSTTKFEIKHGHIAKSVYAVNGSTAFVEPEIQPGDTITFRLKFPLPSSDYDTLEFIDYLPLPIFDAGEVTVFNDVTSATAPAAGEAQFGPDDTIARVPTLTSDAGSNWISFDFGSYDDPADTPTEMDILFTVTMSDDPYADGTVLTNLGKALEGRTNNGTEYSSSVDQFTLKEPAISLRKGVIATDNALATFSVTPGPVTFNPPGSVPPFDNVIASNDQDAGTPLINANIYEMNPGDIVTFAVVLENLGDSTLGAFDIAVRDEIPAGMSIPAGGLNLQILRGDGAPMTTTPVGGTTTDPSGFFDDGILFEDASPTVGAAQAYNTSNGRNILIITYDLQIDEGLAWGTIITNTATLLSYAGTEGGPNHVGAAPTNGLHTDNATVTLLPPGEDVGSTGGTVLSDRWEVNVPAGLLADGSFVSIMQIADDAGLSLGANLNRLNSTVNIRIFDPSGNPLTTFDPPLEICYYYTAANLDAADEDPGNLIINTAVDEYSSWSFLETYHEAAEGKVCASVNHLSLFTLTVPGISALPDTGFAPDVQTTLPDQPADKAYSRLGELWLEIPSLDVELSIIGVPKSGESWDVTWLGDQAGYLEGTAFPTWNGNTALTAHVYDANGAPGPFVDLHELGYGDLITIHAWGTKYVYQVQNSSQVSPDDISVLAHTEYDWITLLTCQSFVEDSNNYLYRRAVQAILIKVEAE